MKKNGSKVTTSVSVKEYNGKGTLFDLECGLVYTGDVVGGWVEGEVAEISISLEAEQVATLIQNQHPDKVYQVKSSDGDIDEFVSIPEELPYGATFDNGQPVPIYRARIYCERLNNLQVIDKRERFKQILKRGEWSPGPTIEYKDISVS